MMLLIVKHICSNINRCQFRYRLNSATTVYDTAMASNAEDQTMQVKLYEFGPIGNFPSSNHYGKTYRISVRIKKPMEFGALLVQTKL